MENHNVYPTVAQQMQMARLLSSDPVFKASKGWRYKFGLRHHAELKGLKKLYYSYRGLASIAESENEGSSAD